MKAIVKEVIVEAKNSSTFKLKCEVDDIRSGSQEVLVECNEAAGVTHVQLRNTTLNEDRLDDLTTLSHLTEPAVLSTIQSRYLDNTIYTYSGLVLVSLNPYCDLGLYGESLIQAYSGKLRGDLEPHLFAVAEDAFRSMQRERRNQSIIISGESGAGKTISARWVMRYFAAVDSATPTAKEANNSTLIEARVLASNPILEAFGNAKTTRNDNSSRFGKYVQIFFDARNEIKGAEIRIYLLEKTRVVGQAAGERNYHIFYQLLQGASKELAKELLIDEKQEFKYLQNGRKFDIDNVDDAKEFALTLDSMKTAGFDEESQNMIFRILAAILHLGNVEFEADGEEKATLSPKNPNLIKVCQLLKANPESMAKWLTRKMLVTKVDSVEMQLTVWQAEAARNAVAKYLYERVFNFLVQKLNALLAPPAQTRAKNTFIGVLDIYGFEKFDHNSFEQFCINYANEKLQHEFNLQVFKLEQELYEREAIEWSFINFADNQPCIDMIEARGGILDLLDEECRFPAGSDESFRQKLAQQIPGKSAEISAFFLQDPLQEPGSFCIRHFAYDVAYNCTGFLEKNRDLVPIEVLETLQASESKELVSRFLDSKSNVSKLSTGATFRDSLRDLMEIIKSTQVHYIRCIKPNCTKAPLEFDPPFVLQQLRAGGIIETIKISAAGYPARWSFEEFVERYGLLSSQLAGKQQNNAEARDMAVELLQGLTDLGPEHYQIGKTKIFLRAGILAELETLRSERLRKAATLIQSKLRAIWIRERVQKQLTCITQLQSSIRQLIAKEKLRERRQAAAITTIASAFRGFQARSFIPAAKDSISLIQARFRAHFIKEHYIKALRNAMAIRIQNAFRSHRQKLKDRSNILAVQTMQQALRCALAKRELNELRAEAHSMAKLKQVSLGLEQKIVDLQTRIDYLSKENKRLQADLKDKQSRVDELSSLESKLADLKLSKTENDQEMKDLKAQLQAKQSELAVAQQEISSLKQSLAENEAKVQELQRAQSEQATTITALQTALDALKQDHSQVLEASAIENSNSTQWKRRFDELHEEKIQLEAQFQRLELFVRQLMGKQPSQLPAAMKSNSSLMNFVAGAVESEEEAKLVTFVAAESAKLEDLLSSLELEKELLQLIASAPLNSTPESLLQPARIFYSWFQLSVDSPHLHDLTENRMLMFLETIRSELSTSADDRKCAFWMSNLIHLYGMIHYDISSKERQLLAKNEESKSQSASPESQVSWSQLSPPVVLLIRAELLRLIEDIYAAWLRELCRYFGRAALAAILDHQSLANYRVKSKKRSSERFFEAVLNSLVDPSNRSQNSAEESDSFELSINDLLASLDELLEAFNSAQLIGSLREKMLQIMFEHMSVTCFNQFILRRGFISWKRAIQVQYNLSRLEEWYHRSISEGKLVF